MFFKKKKDLKKKKEGTVQENSGNLNFNNDKVESSNKNVEYDLNYREKYTIVLRSFLKDYESIAFERERMVAMLQLGTLDQESIDIIEDVKYQVDDLLETYKSSFDRVIGKTLLLDSQCKNIDFRIRQGLKMESESLEKMNESIFENNPEEFQTAIYSNAKGIELVNECFADIEEIVFENFY